MIDVDDILNRTFSVLLIDWPSTLLPRTLLNAGFRVFGFSPKGFTTAELLEEEPEEEEGLSVFGPTENESGFLVFRRLETAPLHVDLVHVFRPAEELETLISSVVTRLGAEAIWLQPPITSSAARQLAEQYNVALVEGVEIIEAVRRLGIRRSAATQ